MNAAESTPRARDVMAFGQETGRVLSDGRIVGRAEPFAKVFQSSRMVKQAVGLTAWGILEDIALDATLDVEGRLACSGSPAGPPCQRRPVHARRGLMDVGCIPHRVRTLGGG